MSKIKGLFATPKKAITTSLVLVIFLVVMGSGTAYATTAIAESSAIGMDNAKNFAYVDAGVDPAAAEDVEVEFEFKQGQFVYEVEFTVDGVEYTYYIKASDGSVVKKEVEIKTLDGTSVASTVTLTLDEAKAAALADAGLSSSQVTFTEAKMDEDDGTVVYELEFYTSTATYEYEINATTGDICEKSVEKVQTTSGNTSSSSSSSTSTKSSTSSSTASGSTSSSSSTYIGSTSSKSSSYSNRGSTHRSDTKTNSNTSSSSSSTSSSSTSYIGLSKAKSIAVNKAGFTLSEVTFTKAKLEKDDGIMEYEIEFYVNDMEYEVSINALTGAILEYEVEPLDD